MSWFHNDSITQQLMIPDQQPKYFEWDSSRDGLSAAFITSHNTKQHALCSKQQLITLHKYAAVSRDHKHPSREDISSNTRHVCEQTSYVQISVHNQLVHESLFSQYACFIYMLLQLSVSEPLVKTWNSFCRHSDLYSTCWNLYCELLLNCAGNLNTPLCCSANINSLFTFLYTSVSYIQVLLSFKSLARISNYVKLIK